MSDANAVSVKNTCTLSIDSYFTKLYFVDAYIYVYTYFYIVTYMYIIENVYTSTCSPVIKSIHTL